MNTQQVRKTNLRMYRGGYPMSQGVLARRLGIYTNRMSLFMNNKAEISDQEARQFEQRLDKPPRWLDRDNYHLNLSEEECWVIQRLRVMPTEAKKALMTLLRYMPEGESPSATCERIEPTAS